MTANESILAGPPPEQNESAPQTAEADLRTRMIARFEQWLDQTLLDEESPRGLPEQFLTEATSIANGVGIENQPAPEADLYSLFSALTCLTGEIRLQGRAFKQLTDLLSPLSETPAVLEQLREAQAESTMTMQSLLENQADDPDAFPVQFEQVCNVMIDLYDRLQRGLQTCEEGIQSLRSRPRMGWMRRMFAARDSSEPAIRSVEGIRDAAALTLARLQAALQDWGIQRIGRIGEPFDPERMSAVEIRADTQAQPGTVLVVNRSGYALNGAVMATAQVTVSKTSS